LYLLGYWWHHSICYTGLFTTPWLVITISPDSEFWLSDVLSPNGPWISSPSECWQLTHWLTVINWLTDCSLINWILVTDWLFVNNACLFECSLNSTFPYRI
jgi:hypothetical protein